MELRGPVRGLEMCGEVSQLVLGETAEGVGVIASGKLEKGGRD